MVKLSLLGVCCLPLYTIPVALNFTALAAVKIFGVIVNVRVVVSLPDAKV
ncbi:hypothetical protein Barb7_02599 [Bacteroidales bacterium Barb7]|nr:hypothetical protein Barb7_02599 [Bacteroidales bacterium Barb7]